MADIKISEMTTAATLNGTEVSVLSQSQGGQLVSVKATLQAIANWVAVNAEYTSALNTTDKRICGAINELSGAASSLSELSDVSLTTPANGEVLEYNGTSQKWENKDILKINETTFTNPYTKKLVPSGQYTEKLKKLIGASVVWNQLVDANTTSVTIPSGHKYIAKINSVWSVGTSDGTAITVDGSRQDMLTDLTAMFGSTIADYVYTLETQTAGSGIAWLKSYGFFTESYYAYSAPTIQSVSVSGKKNVGKNQVDEDFLLTATGWTKSNGVYSGLNTALHLAFSNGYSGDILFANGEQYTLSFDFKSNEDKITVAGFIYTDGTNSTKYVTGTSWNRYFITSTVGKTVKAILFSYGNSTVVNIKDMQLEKSSTATTYEPYTENTYPLDHTTLRGLFKLDANNNLYADGDEYLPSGDESVRYEERAYQSGDESLANAITDGTTTVVKKSTATTATLTPYTSLQNIESGGTGEFIDYGVSQGTRDVAIPAGNESVYGDNAFIGQIVNYIAG